MEDIRNKTVSWAIDNAAFGEQAEEVEVSSPIVDDVDEVDSWRLKSLLSEACGKGDTLRCGAATGMILAQNTGATKAR